MTTSASRSSSPATSRLVRQILGGARAAWGLAALTAPILNMRLLGLEPRANADYAYTSRLFATRELTVGALATGLAGPQAATAAIRTGVAIDAIDLMSLWQARRTGHAKTGPTIALTLLGLAAIATGALASRDAPAGVSRASADLAPGTSNAPTGCSG